MDPERDQIYYAELKKQAQENQTTKTMVVNLERRVEDTAMKVEECFGRVEENAETVKEVKDQMTKLKETSVRPNEKGSMNTVENIFSSLQDIANAMGTSGSGQFDRGNGKMVSWSFKGQMMGFQWKYIGLCVDTTTGETGTAVTASRDGAIKHSTKDLFQKLTAKNLL